MPLHIKLLFISFLFMSAFDPYSVYSRPSVRTRKGQILRQKPTVFRSAFSTDEIDRSKEVLEAYGYYVSKEQPSPPTPPTPPEPVSSNYWDSVHGLYQYTGTGTTSISVNLNDILQQIENRELWMSKYSEYDHARLHVIVNSVSTYLTNNDYKGSNVISYSILTASYGYMSLPKTESDENSLYTTLQCDGQGVARHYVVPSDFYASTLSSTSQFYNDASMNGYLADYQLDDHEVYEALSLTGVLPDIQVSITDDTTKVDSFKISVEVLIAFYN